MCSDEKSTRDRLLAAWSCTKFIHVRWVLKIYHLWATLSSVFVQSKKQSNCADEESTRSQSLVYAKSLRRASCEVLFVEEKNEIRARTRGRSLAVWLCTEFAHVHCILWSVSRPECGAWKRQEGDCWRGSVPNACTFSPEIGAGNRQQRSIVGA